MLNSRWMTWGVLVVLVVWIAACTYTLPLVATPKPTDQPASRPTNRPTNTPTVTATPTDTPTPTPTPTPLPAVRLTRADLAMFNGDYDAAALDYTAILSSTAPTLDVRAARLGLALLKLRAEDDSAADAFRAYTTDFAGDAREADAWFLLGEAWMRQKNYAGAIDAYRRYQKLRGDVLAAYVNARIGDALRADKKPLQAVEAYQAALAAPSAIALDLREKLAGAYLDANDLASALAQYDAILSVAQFTSYRLLIQSRAVEALDSGGQSRQAHQRRLRMVSEYAAAAANQLACPYYSTYAYNALVALVGANVPVDEFERGLVDYCEDQYDPALAAFTRAIQAGDRVPESRYWAGLTFRAQGDTENALRQFNLIIQNFPTAFMWSNAWLEKGRTYALTKDYATAAGVYREFAAKYPTHSDAAEALWRGGVAAYMAGDSNAALDAWQTLSDSSAASDWNVPALMWQGKLALAQGQALTATLFLSQAVSLDLAGYYGVRSAEWLRGDAVPLRPVSSTLTFDEASQRAEAEAWLAARLGITDTAQLRGLRPDLAADAGLQRGLELSRLGLQVEASDEFDALRSARQNDTVALYQLATLFRDLRMYRHSIAAADAVIRRAGARVADAPLFLGRLVYPTYYADLVLPEARARGLDPLLVFALVRQESLFESLSYSTAAAHGLMQIIPATGQGIATALNWPNYTRTDLYKPYISIKFGVYYLARQRDGLDGDLYAALAAYNGGPGNAARWKTASRGDPDLFYETVSYSETRLYIQRISEYYQVYKQLYQTQ
jgi:soluble lytic murein transglycosylase